MSVLNRQHIFELIRFAVPAEWSDQAVAKLVDRMISSERDDHTMIPGLTYEQRRQRHIDYGRDSKSHA